MNRILVSGAPAAFAKLCAAAESEEYEFVLAEGEPRAAECAGYDAVLFVLPAFTQGRAERIAALVREAAAGVAVLVRAEERAAAEETLGGLGVLVASAGANAKNIPVFGSEIEQVEKGCLASCSLDYVELGRQTGYMIAEILGGKSADGIDYLYLNDDYSVDYNGDVLEKFSLTLPADYSDANDVTAAD